MCISKDLLRRDMEAIKGELVLDRDLYSMELGCFDSNTNSRTYSSNHKNCTNSNTSSNQSNSYDSNHSTSSTYINLSNDEPIPQMLAVDHNPELEECQGRRKDAAESPRKAQAGGIHKETNQNRGVPVKLGYVGICGAQGFHNWGYLFRG